MNKFKIILILFLLFLISACNRYELNECIKISQNEWDKKRDNEEKIISRIMKDFEETAGRKGSLIRDHPDFIKASKELKIEIFRRIVAADKNYLNANTETKEVINKIFNVSQTDIEMQYETKEQANKRIYFECRELS
jgi:hypothetical protein